VVPPVVPPVGFPVVPPVVPPFGGQTVIPPPRADVQNIQERGIATKLAGKRFDLYDTKWGTDQLRVYGYGTQPYPNEFADAIRRGTKFINTAGSIENIVKYLMINKNREFIISIIRILGLMRFEDTIDVCCNLLWYLSMGDNPFDANLTADEKSYISDLDVPNLRRILGPLYPGPTDRASLLFALLSGKSTPRPNVNDLPRYAEVARAPASQIAILAFDLYNIIDEDDQLINIYPPYVHVALQQASVVEPVIINVSQTNIDDYITRFGIVLPTRNVPTTQKAKVDYFIKEIKDYEAVFNRAQGVLPPPALTGKTQDQIKNILSPYTLKEIVDAYEPIEPWRNREELLQIIRADLRGGSRWAWRHNFCNNDNTFNIMEAEPHGTIDKNDPENPTLAYGVQRNYRCYQVDELTASFRDYDGTFIFQVPDWIAPDPRGGRVAMIDKTTGAPLISEFPLESIRQLRILLQNPPPGYQVQPLIAQIDDGINANNDATRRARGLKTQYDAFTPAQQYLAKLYLAWLFIYGMWMRFWKGPGHAWATTRVDIRDETNRREEQRCTPQERDEHVFIQQSILTTLRDTIEKDPILLNWINDLPQVRYNFGTGEGNIDRNPIKAALDGLLLGDQCMGFAGDYMIQTAYYLITRMFGLNKVGAFDDFIAEMMPAVLDLERQVVAYQLAFIKDPDTNPQENTKIKDVRDKYGNLVQTRQQALDNVRRRIRILRERETALGKPEAPNPVPKQGVFEPARVAANAHVNDW
ncbi:Hypothetical protein HVR_LOCUS15, partial [uncultured virus]